MILERSPHSEYLIERDIVKCEQSLAIKKKKSVESLRLRSVNPDRIMKWNKTEPCQSKIQIPSGQDSTVWKASSGKKCVLRHPSTLRIKLPRRRREVGNGVGNREQKCKLLGLIPPHFPDPTDENMAAQCVRSLSCVVEERVSALKSCQSQSTSTFEAHLGKQDNTQHRIKSSVVGTPGTSFRMNFQPRIRYPI